MQDPRTGRFSVTDARGGSSRWRTGWILLTGAALLLRVAGATAEALWYDEVAVLWRTDVPGPGGLVANLLRDNQAPLFDLLVWALTRLGDPGTFALRLPSILAGTALVPVVGALAARVLRPLGRDVARRGALLAAAWVALAPWLVRWSQELRPYALLVLLTATCWWAAATLVGTRGRRGAGTLACCGAALVLVHYYGLLAWLPVAAWLVACGGRFGARRGRVALALLAVPAALLPWSPAALYQLATKSYAGVYRPLDAGGLLEVLDAAGPAGSLAAPAAVSGGLAVVALVVARILTVALLVSAVLAAVLAARAARRRRRDGAAAATAATAATAADAPTGPTAVAAVADATPDPMLQRASAATAWVGLALIAGGLLLPVETLSGLASSILVGGRPLDAEQLDFLGGLPTAGRAAGVALVLLGAALRRWPSLRLAGRAEPGALVALSVGVVLPPMAVLLVDLFAQATFAPRNLLVVVPPVAVLAGAGFGVLPRAPRRVAAAALLLLAVTGLAHADRVNDRRPWPGLSLHLAAQGFGGPEDVVAFPGWIGRCVEHHAGWAWTSVERADRPDAVAEWAAPRDRVALVHAYGGLRDPQAVREALARSHARTGLRRLDRVVLETWERR